MRWLLALLAAVATGGCAGVRPEPEPEPLPGPYELPEQVAPPDPLEFFGSGARVGDGTARWPNRRAEILQLFARYVYGEAPPAETSWRDSDRGVVAGGDLHTGWVDGWRVAVFLPPGDGPHPLLLALNKCGNASVHAAPELSTLAWNPASCSDEPGSRAGLWPIDELMARGWAVATVHGNNIAADDPNSPTGLTIARWAGALGAIACGLSDRFAPASLVVAGHSRRGKAALLAAAHDESCIDAAVGHQTGTAGAALSRSLAGEPIESITSIFPHWLHPDFAEFAGRETFLPVDQHLLLAAIAARPVLLTDGEDDAWADPDGVAQAVELARPVFGLWGTEERIEQRVRPGGHELTPADWFTWVDWLEDQL